MKRDYKKQNSVILIAMASIVVITVFLLFSINFKFIGKKSLNENAKTYKTRHCMVYYPDSDYAKKYAKNLCKGVKDDSIYDYSLIPYGDFYLVNYGGDNKYFADSSFNEVIVNELNDEGKKIVVDYLRYYFKKDYPDKYYDVNFLTKLNIDEVDFSEVTYVVSGEELICNFPQYEMEIAIPLKVLQSALDMNFGFPYEIYRKPVYIDPDPAHPIVCLTFDDGPKLWVEKQESSSVKIVDLLYKYDANGTFFLVGDTLENRDIWADYQVYTFLKKSINNGNEYGSHMQTHLYNLSELSDENALAEINGPIKYMKEFMNYEMKIFRPVEGVMTDFSKANSPVPAILWDIDSEDWDSDSVDEIYNQVMKYDIETGDIILFHDIYMESYEALERIIPQLIKQGCQLVTISDLFNYLEIDSSTISYFYSPGYYE